MLAGAGVDEAQPRVTQAGWWCTLCASLECPRWCMVCASFVHAPLAVAHHLLTLTSLISIAAVGVVEPRRPKTHVAAVKRASTDRRPPEAMATVAMSAPHMESSASAWDGWKDGLGARDSSADVFGASGSATGSALGFLGGSIAPGTGLRVITEAHIDVADGWHAGSAFWTTYVFIEP